MRKTVPYCSLEAFMGKQKSNQPSNNDRRTFLKAGGLMTAAALGSAALPRVARGQSSSSRPLPLNSATSKQSLFFRFYERA